MLTRLVRVQLIAFTIAALVGISLMVTQYMQVPTLLGIGRITVTLELPASGGLYRFGNVTYRGKQIGTVTGVRLTRDGAEATLSLDTSPEIPEDLRAEIRSVSAVGEQYVELLPRTGSSPYLRDGSVIPVRHTSLPQPIGPVLDRAEALVDSIPKDKLGDLLDETFSAFNGAGYDLGSLIDSSSRVIGDIRGVADQTRTLIDDSVPLLDSQARASDATRLWARSLAGVSEQLRANDPQIRTLLNTGAGAAREASKLLSQIKPTLPILLANLSTVGQVLVTYNASLEQVLVLLPPNVASTQSQGSANNATGLPMGDFALTMGDPTPCTAGYLPPSAWRSPADTSDVDTPDGLYCKLPQDAPIAVRGARNYPCIEHPGKRAPTVEICNSDRPFEPLVMRQHALGPYPMDPNLVSQGVPLDGRVNPDEHIFGPVEGTPLPPAVAPEQGPPSPPDSAPVTPSAFSPDESGLPPVAVASYDPWTGRYLGPDQRLYEQSNLVATKQPASWQDLLPN